MARIKSTFPQLIDSHFLVYVERNLGFEAEHHQRAFKDAPRVNFRLDEKAGRYGILTTQPVKHAMCQLTDVMLRESRVHLMQPFVSLDEAHHRKQLRDQLTIYSFQFKQGVDTFQKDRMALSGKVGGMRDDIAITLQLALYWTDYDMRNAV